MSADGKTPLRRAINDFGENHEITLLLRGKNAEDMGDEEADMVDDQIGDIDYFEPEEGKDEDDEDDEEDGIEPMSDDEDL